MNINPISFQGTFRSYYTTTEDDGFAYRKAQQFTRYAGGTVRPVPVRPDSKGYYPTLHGRPVYLIGVANCPSQISEDMFQGFCKTYNVKYVQDGDESLLDTEGIRRRTKKGDAARNIAFLADLDVAKFEEAIEKQKHSNLEAIEEEYSETETRNKTDDFILSGLDIPAPTLFITPRHTDDYNEVVEDIKSKGMDGIDKDALDISFQQLTDNPDQCLYCAMKKFGLTKFPVCVMEDTYKIGEAAGFLSPYTKPSRPRKDQITTY